MSLIKPLTAGTLDPQFGSEGVVPLPFQDVGGTARVVLPLLENRLLIALGTVAGSPANVVRLNEDGSRDVSFGVGGVAEIIFPQNKQFAPTQLLPTTKGGWVGAGHIADIDRVSEVAAVRFGPDGQPDPDFGDKGIAIINVYDLLGIHTNVKFVTPSQYLVGDQRPAVETGVGRGPCTTVQSNGSVVLLGDLFYGEDDFQGIVIRLTEKGLLDLSFNSTGFVLVEIPEVERRWNSVGGVAVQADGKVLIVGSYSHAEDGKLSAYVIRYDTQGQFDLQFGGNKNGLFSITQQQARGFSFGALTLTPGINGVEGILASGWYQPFESSADKGLITLINHDGSFNCVFNNGQPLFTQLMPKGELWLGVGLQQNLAGQAVAIIVSGQGFSDSADEALWLVAARYLMDGSQDMSFGIDGFVRFNDSKAFVIFQDGAVTIDNKVVMSGYALIDFSEPISGYVVRYLG
jgi:uncharacterized delta-60 repeat protein